ncbi:hypothetical protein COW46_02185 [Candidatus Gracilibacteria bacterium CG17_big_fil_post_rev_8_21_14_2_50_48_13]|nr:MAG: hypothetical protein COW46_02185 [Candidatus Gracilibacteria bacterium CG17_big_fil_post_rev_8_21_14_2_50_48_13]
MENQEDEEGKVLNSVLTKDTLPTGKYESDVGIYEWSAGIQGNSIIFQLSLLDRIVGAVARHVYRVDDNSFKSLRHKASEAEVYDNVIAMQLGSHFGYTPRIPRLMELYGGYESVPYITELLDDYKDGVLLDDLLRKTDRRYLGNFSAEEGIRMAGALVKEIHRCTGRGIGELLTNDILLRVDVQEDGTCALKDARLTLPDSIYEEHVPTITQKSMDIVEFCFSLCSAALLKNLDPQTFLQVFFDSYCINDELRSGVLQQLERGFPRQTFHNLIKLGFDRLQEKKKRFEDARIAIVRQVTLFSFDNPGFMEG